MSKSWTSYLTEQAIGTIGLTIIATDYALNKLTGTSFLNENESLGEIYNQIEEERKTDALFLEFEDDTKTVIIKNETFDEIESEFLLV